MVSFVDDEPVRPGGSGTEILNSRQQAGETSGAVIERNSEQVDEGVLIGVFQGAEQCFGVEWFLRSAERKCVGKAVVVSLGVDDTELVFVFGELFEDSCDSG